LNLTKRRLSIKLNVSDITVYLWEKNRIKPSLTQIPKIIAFLGRDPFAKKTENLGEKILYYRRVHGLSQKKLAEQLGVNQTTLAACERGEHRPSKKKLENVLHILGFHPSSCKIN